MASKATVSSESSSMQLDGILKTDGSLKTSTIFTISPSSLPGMCLDFAEGHGMNYLQIWPCNGHENQLFYFDPDSYKITWGGDTSKCVDAGDLKLGNTLFLWECNGTPQQTWSYDDKMQTVYLAGSKSDADFCMDLAGAAKNAGTTVQLWSCNGLWEQKWTLMKGITIRPLTDTSYCMDLPGGSTQKGTKVELWKCNGKVNQKWYFDSGTYQIKPVSNPNMCLDNGGLTKSPYLFIWDCNDSKNQIWAYDFVNMRTLYLSSSTSSDASVCIDVTGGNLADGQLLQTWDCNSCWNQQWQVIGPNSQDMMRVSGPKVELKTRNATTVSSKLRGTTPMSNLNGCPKRPGPAPAPAPPGRAVFPHCEVGDQHGWTKFDSVDDLKKDAAWSSYFQLVYGEVPTTGYSICTYGLTLLYKPLVAQAGLSGYWTPDEDCPKTAGKPYAKMSGFPASDWSWIWNPILGHPNGYSLTGNHWVEVMHTAFKMDGSATWFYYTPGSGIYMWLGNTKVYDDHPDAVADLLSQQCMDPPKSLGPNECGQQFEQLYKAAKLRKYDTLQFTKHADMQCTTKANYMGNMAIEIVDLAGPGGYACSEQFPNGATEGWSRFRAGWEGKYKCYCDNNQKAINCKGFGMTP